MSNFNDTHPELRPSERFFTNYPKQMVQHAPTLEEMMFRVLDNPSYKSARLGQKSYANDGTPLDSCRPIFVTLAD